MIQISTNYYKKKFSAIRRTRYFSLIYSPQDKQSLPNGCKYCVKGEKTVLFVTGLCPKNCFYCPISDEKKNNDVIFFNELQMDSNQDNDKLLNAYIKEANSHFSKGAGITGGDPLASIERTCFFISSLKQKFGKTYHIHLYTSLDLVSDEKLFSLKKAGLDEIRFHIDVFDKKYWNRLELLNKYNFDVGIEIPLIPPLTNYLLYCNLLDFVKDKVDFINLNELETSDSSYNTILEKGYIVKNRYSYAIKNSFQLGVKLLYYMKNNSFNLISHLCTAKLKDRIQLRNRMKLKSQYLKKSEIDVVSDDGMLIRGVIYLKKLSPLKHKQYSDFTLKIKQNLLNNNDTKLLNELNEIYLSLREKYDVFFDYDLARILISFKVLNENIIFFKLNYENCVFARIEEYPSEDKTCVDLEFL